MDDKERAALLLRADAWRVQVLRLQEATRQLNKGLLRRARGRDRLRARITMLEAALQLVGVDPATVKAPRLTPTAKLEVAFRVGGYDAYCREKDHQEAMEVKEAQREEGALRDE